MTIPPEKEFNLQKSYTSLELIHVDIWQNQYNIVKLKKKRKEKKKKSYKNIFLNIWKLIVRLITTYYHHYHCLVIQQVLLKLLLLILYSCKSRGSHLTYRKYLSYNPFTSSVLSILHSHWMSLALTSLLSRWRVWTSEWLNSTRKIVQSETATSEIWISFFI